MTMLRSRSNTGTALLLAGLLIGSVACGAGAAESRFISDIDALCRAPHRLAATPEFNNAADYIVEQLREAGITNVMRQSFTIAQSETECYLEVNTQIVPMLAMRANLWQLPTSGTGEISGETIYAGDGSPEAYGKQQAEGKIVVLDYETARRWSDAFAMGARAVIFVETGGIPESFQRFTDVSSDLPRFYVRKQDAILGGLMRSGNSVTIRARGGWESRESQNVLALIPGTDPVFSLEKEEAVVFSAQLDSFGEVPYLARGARGAANCAALLEIARRLNADKPRRTVLIAFLGGEARGLSGSAAMYSAILRNEPFLGFDRTHSLFIDEHQAEKKFLSEIIDAVQSSDIFAGRGESFRQALELLRREADFQAQELVPIVRPYNTQIDSLTRQRDKSRTAGDMEAVSELESNLAALKAELKPIKDTIAAWDKLRRALAKENRTDEVSELLQLTCNSVAAQSEDRIRELDTFIGHRRQSEELGRWLSSKAIVLHLTIDLSDRGPRWGLAQSDNEAYLAGADYNTPGYYVGVFGAFADILAKARAKDSAALRMIEPRTIKVQLGPPVFFPAEVMHGGQMASRFGIYGLRVATCHDALPFSGHPSDTPENIDLQKIEQFALDAVPFVLAAASEESLSLRQRIRPMVDYNEPKWAGERMKGYNVMTRSEGSAIANRPARGALLGMCRHTYVPGFDAASRYIVWQNGHFAVGPIPRWGNVPADWCCVLLDEAGAVSEVNSAVADLARVEMFPCRQHTVVAMSPPEFPAASTILNSANDGMFRQQEFYSMEKDQVISFFLPLTTKGVKLVNTFGMTLLNATSEEPSGTGFPVGDMWKQVRTEYHTAHDLFTLDEDRLQILRERKITNDSLEWLHGLARAALQRADEADSAAARYAELGIARLLSRRAYKPILNSMNDLVKAVVILLLLTIPFAYALERLLVGTPHIYRQIGWYMLFFMLTFAILYKIHPAFAIATEPVVIFLAFIIIILSSMVILILLSRFQAEVKAVQGLRATVHSADVSRFGTVLAAVAMGISTMRRRPMRTLLTTVTVLLLTFSILSFASFDAQGGILRRYVGSTEDVRCIFIHNALWNSLTDRLLDITRHIVGKNGTVAPRRWVAAMSAQEADLFSLLVAAHDGEDTAQIKGLVGLEKADIAQQPGLRACFPSLKDSIEFPADAIFLPPATAESMKLQPGDKVLVRGYEFTFAGMLDAEALTLFAQIDRTPIFPVNFADESMKQSGNAIQSNTAEGREIANLKSESAFLPYYNANQVGIIHSAMAEKIGGQLVAVSIYPDEPVDIQSLGDRVARVSWAPIYATLTDGTYRMLFTTVLATSGMGNLIIPIILGGLIVFGTMLGSVSDRTKEIYSFSALGLAPAHIGMLFFAEATVYAVVGGLGGYILAQAVAFVTGWLSTFTTLNMPEMNYSSTNAIFAILVVMATVLLSTVYPAIRGSRSANPGVARTWRMPRPKGDLWEFTFPFTVSEYDITGVMSFLYEHFSNFSDCSLGVFLAENTRIYSSNNTLNLESKVATSPFDLGVTQQFHLTSMPSEIKGVDEVKIAIRRLSGTAGDWERTNRPFISDLRKQFLIWRSIAPETMELYRTRTLEVLGKAQKPEAGKQ